MVGRYGASDMPSGPTKGACDSAVSLSCSDVPIYENIVPKPDTRLRSYPTADNPP